MSSKPRQKDSMIEKNVMAKIQAGQVKMHPKYYYLLLSTISVLAILLLGLVTSYFMSVVTLWIRIQNAAGPAYGARRNLSSLVGDFPWWALVLGILSFVAIVYIVRKVGGLYKIRLIYLAPIVIAVSLILGFAFSYSALPNTFKSHSPHAVCDSNNINCDTPGQGLMRGRQMK
ncbi:MAG: hypothetical protein M0R39_17815 [Prolixibacteraceae bacterium]|nr:hypothetical protein [Prolixibacteraceae bacterium]